MECQSKTDGDGAGTALRNASMNEDTKLSTISKPRHRHEPLSSVNSSILFLRLWGITLAMLEHRTVIGTDDCVRFCASTAFPKDFQG